MTEDITAKMEKVRQISAAIMRCREQLEADPSHLGASALQNLCYQRRALLSTLPPLRIVT